MAGCAIVQVFDDHLAEHHIDEPVGTDKMPQQQALLASVHDGTERDTDYGAVSLGLHWAHKPEQKDLELIVVANSLWLAPQAAVVVVDKFG